MPVKTQSRENPSGRCKSIPCHSTHMCPALLLTLPHQVTFQHHMTLLRDTALELHLPHCVTCHFLLNQPLLTQKVDRLVVVWAVLVFLGDDTKQQEVLYSQNSLMYLDVWQANCVEIL